MANESIAINLRRHRQAHALSQAQLAEAAGISVGAYRNLETRKSVPRIDTLRALADVLEIPIQELLIQSPELSAVRFRSFKTLKTREQILVRVGRWLEDFNALEEVLEHREDFSLSGLGQGASPAELARLVRRRLELSPREPVRDICGFLEANGVKVLPISVKSNAFFGLSVAPGSGGPAIVVNVWDRISVERWIFTAGHELGHLLLHMADYDVGEKKESKEEEQEANAFASELLMPEEGFRSEWNDTYGMALTERVLKIKRLFRVSYRSVLYRLSEKNPQIWRDFQRQYRLRYGKALLGKDEPEALAINAFKASFPESSRALEPERLSRADFIEDRLSRLVRKAVEQGKISLGRGAEILGLSLMEMRELAGAWVG